MGARLIPAKTTQQIVNSAFKLIKPPLNNTKRFYQSKLQQIDLNATNQTFMCHHKKIVF